MGDRRIQEFTNLEYTLVASHTLEDILAANILEYTLVASRTLEDILVANNLEYTQVVSHALEDILEDSRCHTIHMVLLWVLILAHTLTLAGATLKLA